MTATAAVLAITTLLFVCGWFDYDGHIETQQVVVLHPHAKWVTVRFFGGSRFGRHTGFTTSSA